MIIYQAGLNELNVEYRPQFSLLAKNISLFFAASSCADPVLVDLYGTLPNIYSERFEIECACLSGTKIEVTGLISQDCFKYLEYWINNNSEWEIQK